MSKQSNLSLESKSTGPVECLGKEFSSDEARREHYLALLAEKLKEPGFRKIEGFPIGEDEDILALSDPPYYTACPNPWIGEFIEHYGRPYDPKEKYHREPFAADVSEGKNHPIYNAHSYHTKVPHRAIMRYILHYTDPGDVILDGFCGTGMTGVAAQLCGNQSDVEALGYRCDDKGTIFNEAAEKISQLGARMSVLGDLSTAATFFASGYNCPSNQSEFLESFNDIHERLQEKHGWMYRTVHTDGKTQGVINYTVWSDILICPGCAEEIVYWDTAMDTDAKKLLKQFCCPNCGLEVSKSKCDRAFVSVIDTPSGEVCRVAKQIPVLIDYNIGKKRFTKAPSPDDLRVLEKISSTHEHTWIPTSRMPPGDESRRNDSAGLTHTHQFYTHRSRLVMADYVADARKSKISKQLLFVFTSAHQYCNRLCRLHVGNYFHRKGGTVDKPLEGTLYFPSLSLEVNVLTRLRLRSRLGKALAGINGKAAITTQSFTKTPTIPDASIDYLFIDPPFGANITYSDLNVLWESWLRVSTDNEKEAIVSRGHKKSGEDYRGLMRACFGEAYRVLKPGRWLTVEFSNTKASIWNSIQTALIEAGFIVANVSSIDKQKGSFKAVTTPTAVKQDLVISAYKPNGGLEARFEKSGHTVEGVWDFLRTHLRNLPVLKPRGGDLEFITERNPRILHDRMVAFYIGHGVPVPLSSAEFQRELADKFPEREGMFFLPEQVAEWDKKRAQMQGVGQMSIFVEDEKSAIDWLRNFLKVRPSVTSDITSEFMQTLGASWKKFETRPELQLLLTQNFLKYEGQGDVPSQIHSYLSTQNKDLRNLEKSDARLKQRAKDRWYVPDPAKAVDVEAIRNKRLMQEFWELCDQAGIARPTAADPNQRTLPISTPAAKKAGRKKLKEVRTEAVRIGFKDRFAAQDYATILALSDHLPTNVIEEDEQLQMIHDMAEMRSEV